MSTDNVWSLFAVTMSGKAVTVHILDLDRIHGRAGMHRDRFCETTRAVASKVIKVVRPEIADGEVGMTDVQGAGLLAMMGDGVSVAVGPIQQPRSDRVRLGARRPSDRCHDRGTLRREVQPEPCRRSRRVSA